MEWAYGFKPHVCIVGTGLNNRAGVKPSDPMCLRKVQIVQNNDGMAFLKMGPKVDVGLVRILRLDPAPHTIDPVSIYVLAIFCIRVFRLIR